mgnify:CR=1 FL=1
MSYILDALRRADAERERDPARGIHAQPTAGLPTRSTRAISSGTWTAGAGALVAIAAAAWWLARPAPEAPVVRVPVAAQGPVTVVATTPSTPTPVVVPVAAAVSPPPPAPVAAAVSPPAPAPMPVAMAEKPAAKPVPVAAVPAKPVVVAAVPAKAAPVATTPAVAAPAAAAAPATAAPAAPAAAPPTPAAPAAAAERIVAMGDLPPDVQRELPKLAISGGVHSENASQRLLIVGGQVMTEGAEVAPGVTLEQIRARTAVLRYRGFKYSVPF